MVLLAGGIDLRQELLKLWRLHTQHLHIVHVAAAAFAGICLVWCGCSAALSAGPLGHHAHGRTESEDAAAELLFNIDSGGSTILDDDGALYYVDAHGSRKLSEQLNEMYGHFGGGLLSMEDSGFCSGALPIFVTEPITNANKKKWAHLPWDAAD